VFRIQREIQVKEALLRDWKEEAKQQGRQVNEEELLEEAATYRWIPWADRLLIGAVTVALLLVLLPVALVGSKSSSWGGRLPAAGRSAPTVALAGYIPALLGPLQVRSPSHSQLDLVWDPIRPHRYNVEPAEKAIVKVSAILGLVAAVLSIVVTG